MANYNFEKKITVLMPVFNEERYIKDAIKSILNQTYPFFEFIIINDGSTDKSEKIIHSFDDDRIIYKKNKKNLGLIETLNLGILLSKCGFIARMDADDISHITRLEKQINYLKSNSDFVAIGSFFRCIDSKGRFIENLNWPNGIKKILYSSITGFCPVGHPGTMYKKSAVIEVGSYDKNFYACEDYELWLRLLANGYKINNLNEYLLDYRKHKNQVSFNYRAEQLTNHIKAFQLFYEKLTKRKLKLDDALKYVDIFNFRKKIKNNHLNLILGTYNNLNRKILELHMLNNQRSYFDSLVINFIGKNMKNLSLFNILKSIANSKTSLFYILKPLFVIFKTKFFKNN